MAYLPKATADINDDETAGKTMLSSSGSEDAVASGPVPAEYKMLCSAMIRSPFKIAGLGSMQPAASRVLIAGSSGPSIPPIFGGYW